MTREELSSGAYKFPAKFPGLFPDPSGSVLQFREDAERLTGHHCVTATSNPHRP